jgi:hypothetical protein
MYEFGPLVNEFAGWVTKTRVVDDSLGSRAAGEPKSKQSVLSTISQKKG